ncbi:hypothetical protein [Streptomyces sp. CAU 1734]|uniref:hypothetical protein n=1 Tax=Streptomyces sp. CAU 1734 TaxID=3140360 RepID=UPI003260B228
MVDRGTGRLIAAHFGAPPERQVADHERRLRREAHARNTAAAGRAARERGDTVR